MTIYLFVLSGDVENGVNEPNGDYSGLPPQRIQNVQK